MKKLFYLFTITFCTSLYAQRDPAALDVLNAMSAKYKKIAAYEADFTQNMVNENAGINENITGTITVKNNKYLLKVAGQEIYNNGTDVYNYNQELSEVTINPFEPEDEEITLSNIYDLYKSGFKYAMLAQNQGGNRVIELQPESKDKSYFKIRLEIAQDNSLKKFTVFDKSGSKYNYVVNTFKEKTGLTDTYFTFDVKKHPNVEVIDFR